MDNPQDECTLNSNQYINDNNKVSTNKFNRKESYLKWLVLFLACFSAVIYLL